MDVIHVLLSSEIVQFVNYYKLTLPFMIMCVWWTGPGWWILGCMLLSRCLAVPGKRIHNRGFLYGTPFHLCNALAENDKITLQGVLRRGDYLFLVVNGYTHEIHLVGQRATTLKLRHSLFMLNDAITELVFKARAGVPEQRVPPDYDNGGHTTTETPETEEPTPEPTEPEPLPEPTTTKPPCAPDCPPCVDPDNPCNPQSYVTVVPWYEHPWTKSGDPEWDTSKVELWRLNMAHYKRTNDTWKHYLFKGGHTMLFNLKDRLNCKYTHDEYRYFAIAGDGLHGGLTFCYTEYIPFNQESLTEDVDVIIKRRRVVVAALDNHKRPILIPKTVNDRLMVKNKYHTLTTTEDRSTVMYDKFMPETALEAKNDMDLFKTVPFGFIFSSKVYVFSIASKEVVISDYPKKVPKKGGKGPVIIKTWSEFFLCKGVHRGHLTPRDSSEKLSQSEYTARVANYSPEELDGRSGVPKNLIFFGAILLLLPFLGLLYLTNKNRLSKLFSKWPMRNKGKQILTKGISSGKRTSTKTTTTSSDKNTKRISNVYLRGSRKTDTSSTAKRASMTKTDKGSSSTKRPSTRTSKQPSTKNSKKNGSEKNSKKPSSKKPSSKKPSSKKPSSKKPNSKKPQNNLGWIDSTRWIT